MTVPVERAETASARRHAIVRELRSVGYLSVGDLSRQLGVSDMTVRRDLRKLERAGAVRVVHGGVSVPHGTLQAADFVNRAGLHAEAKKRIARHALGFVPPGATIALDAGTTVYELAAALPDSFAGGLVTHSIPVVQRMLAGIAGPVVCLGGELLPDSQAFVGQRTVDAAAGLRVNTLFLGAAAVDARGVYVAADVERPTKRALIGIADQVVLLADISKFHIYAPVLLAPLNELSAVVTDAAPPAAAAHALDAAGVQVHVVAPPDGHDPSLAARSSG